MGLGLRFLPEMELGLCLILLALLGSSRSEFLKGVNYGNAFIPEDWMTNDQESIYGERYGSRVSQPSDVARVSLCDVTDDRILRWLEDVVKEEDFVEIQEPPVGVLGSVQSVPGQDLPVGGKVQHEGPAGAPRGARQSERGDPQRLCDRGREQRQARALLRHRLEQGDRPQLHRADGGQVPAVRVLLLRDCSPQRAPALGSQQRQRRSSRLPRYLLR